MSDKILEVAIKGFKDIAQSIHVLSEKSDKDIEIKIVPEARDLETNEFIAYGPPVWIKIPK